MKQINELSQIKHEKTLRGRPREFDLTQALESAMELFWEKGYIRTTLGDLCQAINIKPPSFYCAFGTRENLFLQTLRHYKSRYWDNILNSLMTEKDLHIALKNFLDNAVRVYTRPNLPHGCFVDISTIGLPESETAILQELVAMDRDTRQLFRNRLMRAVTDGQIPRESDVPVICGSIMAFMKGLATLARGDIDRSGLADIAARGLLLLPLCES